MDTCLQYAPTKKEGDGQALSCAGFGGGGRDDYDDDAYDDYDGNEEPDVDDDDDDDDDDGDDVEEEEEEAPTELGDEPALDNDDDAMEDAREEAEAAVLQALMASQAEAEAAIGATEGTLDEVQQAMGVMDALSGVGTDALKEAAMECGAGDMPHAGLTGTGGEQNAPTISAVGQAADLLAGMSPDTPSVGEAPAKAASPPWAAAGSPPGATAFPGTLPETNPAAEAPVADAEVALKTATAAVTAATESITAATQDLADFVAHHVHGVPQNLANPPDASQGPPGGVPGYVPPLPAAGASPLAGAVPPPGFVPPQGMAQLAGLYGLPPGMAGVGPSSDKRKERKDKEEAREERLRERERQADIRLALAAEALTETLTGAGGQLCRGWMGRLPVISCAPMSLVLHRLSFEGFCSYDLLIALSSDYLTPETCSS